MDVGDKGVRQFELDACDWDTRWILVYAVESRRFTWKRFERQDQLLHMPANAVTQICDKYSIMIKLRAKRIHFSTFNESQLEESNKACFVIPLPEQSMKSKIAFFTPRINDSKTLMVLAMSYGKEDAEERTFDKYHGLVLVDLVQKRAFQNDQVPEYFSTVLWRTDDELLCQNSSGVYRVYIDR